SREALAGLFGILKGNVRVVVLNGFNAKSHALALRKTIDYSIGMNAPISHDASVAFSAGFYEGLAFGRTVPEAFELGKNKMAVLRVAGSDAPKLYVRDGAVDSMLFPTESRIIGNSSRQTTNESDNARPEEIDESIRGLEADLRSVESAMSL